MTKFLPQGPFNVPFYRGKAGRTITDDNVEEFWNRHRAFAGRRGCYVFGVRAGKGITPAYVGMASRAYKGEVFAPHKLARYQQLLADYGKGTPVVFFIVAPTKRGAPNVSHIKDLERFLIEVGVATNPELLNKKGTKSAEWSVVGVLRGGQGNPSRAAAAFRQMMAL